MPIGVRNQDCCAAIVSRFSGYVARYMGDGMLIYFGYPQAHEDDAERAIRAGLSVIESVGQLAPRADLRLKSRIGVASGLVVAGASVGEASSRERVVTGEIPNLNAPLIASLLGLELEHRYDRIELDPQLQRAQTLEALLSQLRRQAEG